MDGPEGRTPASYAPERTTSCTEGSKRLLRRSGIRARSPRPRADRCVGERRWLPANGRSCQKRYLWGPMAKKEALSKVDVAALSLVDEEDSRQFVLEVAGHRARMEYDRSGDRIFLTHAEVPKPLEAHDVASALTEKVLAWTEANRLKLVPMCPSVKAFLRKNTAWQRLLVKGVQV